MAEIVVSVTRWPIVLVTYPERFRLEDIDRLVVALAPCYARGLSDRPFVSISDVSRVSTSLDFAKERAYLAKVVEQLYLAHPGGKIGEITVTDSPGIRALVKVNAWMRRDKNAFPRETTATVDQALRIAEALLAERRRAF